MTSDLNPPLLGGKSSQLMPPVDHRFALSNDPTTFTCGLLDVPS
jgi:hypothetical protein